MVELGAFHEAQNGRNTRLEMLPLFFKLSIQDLDERSIEERWMPKWREHAETNFGRIDVNKWTEAVKALPKENGFIFEQPERLAMKTTGIIYRSEVLFRKEVVKAILKLSAPDLLYGTSETVVGWDRLCKVLASQFVEDSTTRTFMLGLYGMPGLGKTTLSHALCDYFHSEFEGRVCHVELGDSSGILLRQKEVLKKLCGMDGDAVDRVQHVHQGWSLLKVQLKRQPSVFLVIDDVRGDQHSLDEARAYLEAGFPPKSRIMVTSTGQTIVVEVLMDSKFCVPVPDLTEEEAGSIVLRRAAPDRSLCRLADEESRVLGLFVEQCRFSRNGELYPTDINKQYHPLALRALGNYCRRINREPLLVWEKYLEDVDRSASHDLFDILALQFKSLHEREQLVVLDIAVFGEQWIYQNVRRSYFKDLVTWLAGLRGDTTRASVERMVNQLERYGLISFHGEQRRIAMHQLYKEFAVRCATNGDPSKNEWCAKDSAPPHERTRLRVDGLEGGVPRSRIQREWQYLVVLQLHSCTDIRELNLDGLDRLCDLELIELANLETLIFSAENESLRFVCLLGLNSLKRLPDFSSSCIHLQALVITGCVSLTEIPRVERCSELETLWIDLRLCPEIDIVQPCKRKSLWFKFLGIVKGSGGVVSAGLPAETREVVTRRMHHLERRPLNVASLSSLQELCISNFYGGGEGEVLDLAGLSHCRHLLILDLVGLPVKRIFGLEQVTQMLDLHLIECDDLDEPPELADQTVVGVKPCKERGYIWFPRCYQNLEGFDSMVTEWENTTINFKPENSMWHQNWQQRLGRSVSDAMLDAFDLCKTVY